MTKVKNQEITKPDLSAIKAGLLERKRQLEEELSDLSAPDIIDQIQDSAEQAQLSTMETLKISLQSAEIDEYNRIVQALAMISDGTYGLCIDCGQQIALRRLTLFPNAMRCLPCQELLEENLAE